MYKGVLKSLQPVKRITFLFSNFHWIFFKEEKNNVRNNMTRMSNTGMKM